MFVSVSVSELQLFSQFGFGSAETDSMVEVTVVTDVTVVTEITVVTEDVVNKTIVTDHQVAPTGENNGKLPCYTRSLPPLCL